MSDIQRYLLDYDKSKKDATATAQLSATRNYSLRLCAEMHKLIAIGLQNGELKLLKLIEEMGEFFNSEEPAVRSKSKWIASVSWDVADCGSYGVSRGGACPRSAESSYSTAEYVFLFRSGGLELIGAGNLLCDFVLSRIEDSDGLGSCAKALIALEERGKWDNERVAKIMQTSVVARFRYIVPSLFGQAPRAHTPPPPVQAAERTIPRTTTYRCLNGQI